MDKKVQEEIGTRTIGSFYITTLRDGCDLHKSAAAESFLEFTSIGPDVWRFSSFFAKLKMWVYIYYLKFRFRKRFRWNPFINYRLMANVEHNGLLKRICKRRRTY